MIHPEGKGSNCPRCGCAWAWHDQEKVFPDDGPTGTWHYKYICNGRRSP